MEYEICYLIGESKEAETEKVKEKIRKIVAGESGNFLDFNFVDKRKMAYEIENEIRGTYIANRFKISKKDNNQKSETKSKSAVDSITEKLYLEKDILRFIIVKTDSVPSLEGKEEIKKKGDLSARLDSAKRADKAGKQRAKSSRKRTADSGQEKKDSGKKKEMPRKTAKKEKMGDIDKKLEEILNI